LKELDPLLYDETLKMDAQQLKLYQLKMDEEDRATLDTKWDKLNVKIKAENPEY
jgi:hypothetical protein